MFFLEGEKVAEWATHITIQGEKNQRANVGVEFTPPSTLPCRKVDTGRVRQLTKLTPLLFGPPGRAGRREKMSGRRHKGGVVVAMMSEMLLEEGQKAELVPHTLLQCMIAVRYKADIKNVQT